MQRYYYVYILTNTNNTTFYVGITSNLIRRVREHRLHIVNGVTCKYNLSKLAYYERHTDVKTAITHKKRIKKWQRSWKINLIVSKNPLWMDLYPEILC